MALAIAVITPALYPSMPVESILDYIQDTWDVLTRTPRNMATAAVDPKFEMPETHHWAVYISRDEDLAHVQRQLREEMASEDFRSLDFLRLPKLPFKMKRPGLLYLPKPYVVPGGRFNEMYGWDSYFIQVGLLRDGHVDMARNMADNAIYQVEHYGHVLNANRSYYLSRSQPPFLTQMVLGVYRKTHDKAWLASTLPAIEKFYQFWLTPPHLTRATGLSRYYDLGDGPAPEVISSEKDADGRTHYELIAHYYATHEVPDYDVSQYYNRTTKQLTPLFYKGDRTMRESGFDPSNRFGPFNIDIIHYDPVCLNSLLYLMETETAEILTLLDRKEEAQLWIHRAHKRAAAINRLMWDETDGLYYDYNFVHHNVRRYPYLTTFYPLWAGIATKQQADRIVHNLPLFERDGGLQTSIFQSGNQWDAPFGWAPLQMIAVQGLRRYGYHQEADRIAFKFLSLVHDEYLKHGTIVEKYDVVRRGSDVSNDIQYGYSSNEVGFGWTNAVFTTLYDELPDAMRQHLNQTVNTAVIQ